MKHRIKKYSDLRAGCTRPGCIAGIEGALTAWDNKMLNEYFSQGDCPYVWAKGERLNHEESVKYLINHGKKEIKSWEKLIKYWSKKK